VAGSKIPGRQSRLIGHAHTACTHISRNCSALRPNPASKTSAKRLQVSRLARSNGPRQRYWLFVGKHFTAPLLFPVDHLAVAGILHQLALLLRHLVIGTARALGGIAIAASGKARGSGTAQEKEKDPASYRSSRRSRCMWVLEIASSSGSARSAVYSNISCRRCRSISCIRRNSSSCIRCWCWSVRRR